MLRLIWQELKFRRNAILGWGLGLLFFPVVYVSLYPSVAEEMAGMADLEIYKAMGVNLGNFADWIGSIQIILLPLVASIFGITNGTGTLAGEEEDGRLEMLVTLPLPRWMVVTAKAIALDISLLIVLLVNAFVTWGIFELIKDQIETELVGLDLFTAVLSTWPLVFAMSMLAMFLAVFCSRRRIASMISIAYLIASYFGSNLADSTKVLEPFEPFFLFSYLDQTGPAILAGQTPEDLLTLVGIGLVSFILAVIFFQRRRLTVGMWPWQRAIVEE